MITGKALEYLRALARCCPPQPVDADFGARRARENSIRHCRKRIKLGMLMIRGTMYFPPQFRSGLSVDDVPIVKNMHAETNRSPRTLEYDVNTSARSISPNFPSFASAIPPILTRFKVLRNQYRPVRERRCRGTMKKTTRRNRYDWGRISQARTRDGLPWVVIQKKTTEMINGRVTVAASL